MKKLQNIIAIVIALILVGLAYHDAFIDMYSNYAGLGYHIGEIICFVLFTGILFFVMKLIFLIAEKILE